MSERLDGLTTKKSDKPLDYRALGQLDGMDREGSNN